jgi:hypothetical protein
MKHWRERSASFTSKILAFSPFLRREHSALLMRVEHSAYFTHLDLLGRTLGDQTLEWISPILWDYFQLAIRLRQYADKELARRAGRF